MNAPPVAAGMAPGQGLDGKILSVGQSLNPEPAAQVLSIRVRMPRAPARAAMAAMS